MADNETGIADGLQDHSDWIEIHNSSGDSHNIGGWHLSDDPDNPEKWRFPSRIIEAGGYEVIFASGQPEALSGEEAFIDSGGNIHTNFKLSRNGESLLLTMPDGNTIAHAYLDYPAQREDVSFGLLPEGTIELPFPPTTPFFLPLTTPGLPNDPSGAGISSTVAIAPPPVTFSNEMEVELSSDLPGAEIRYTIDGQTPTPYSPLYSEPITIDISTELRTRLFYSGLQPGPISGSAYIKLDPNIQDFTSNLPVVVLENFDGFRLNEYGMNTFNMSIFEPSDSGGRSALANPPDVSTRIGIRIRGASSVGFDKQQYRVELRDQHDNDCNLPLLGMPTESDWVLNGPWVDKSLIRNPLGFSLGNAIGVMAPRTRHCEVFLNESGGDLRENDYIGVYVLLENIKRGPNRVDIPVLNDNDNDEPDITGGYILRFEFGYEGVLESWETLQIIDAEDYNFTQWQYISDYVNAFDDALPDGDFRSFIDVDSFINNIIIHEILRDQDSYTLSAYMHKDRSGLLTQGPLWDFNLTMGVGCCHENRSLSGWQFDVDVNEAFFTFGERRWIDRLLKDPDFSQQLIDRWHKLRQTILSNESVNERIDAMADPLQEAQERNFEKYPRVLEEYDPGFPSPVTDTWEEQIEFIKFDWFQPRLAWIDGQFEDAPVIDPLHGIPFSQGGKVLITATPGFIPPVIYYTTDGSDPRAPGGDAQGAIFTEPFAPHDNVIVKARTFNSFRGRSGTSMRHTKWSPITAKTVVVSPVVESLRITEIMYHPPNPPQGDPHAEFVELTNVGDRMLNLKLTRLSGGIDFEFPDIDLPPFKSLVVVRDEAAFRAQYPEFRSILAGQYNGALSNDGDSLRLEIVHGDTILDFEYDDEWYPVTDGEGASLVIVDPANTSPVEWSERESWRPGATLLGTPGETDLTITTGLHDWTLYK